MYLDIATNIESQDIATHVTNPTSRTDVEHSNKEYSFNYGILPNQLGSIYFEHDQAKLICYRTCSNEGLSNQATNFKLSKSASLLKCCLKTTSTSKLARNVEDYAAFVAQSISPALINTSDTHSLVYPEIINITILEFGKSLSSTLASCINCASLCLVQSGVPMYSLVTSCKLIEQKHETNNTVDTGLIAIIAKTNKITQLKLNGANCELTTVEKIVEESILYCNELCESFCAELQKLAITGSD